MRLVKQNGGSPVQEAWRRAMAAEAARIHWLGEAADQFHSYDFEVSQALEELYAASLAAKKRLDDAFRKHGGGAETQGEAGGLTGTCREFHERFEGELEFFILSDESALRLLRKLRTCTRQAAQDFRVAAELAPSPLVNGLLAATAKRLEAQAANLDRLSEPYRAPYVEVPAPVPQKSAGIAGLASLCLLCRDGMRSLFYGRGY